MQTALTPVPAGLSARALENELVELMEMPAPLPGTVDLSAATLEVILPTKEPLVVDPETGVDFDRDFGHLERSNRLWFYGLSPVAQLAVAAAKRPAALEWAAIILRSFLRRCEDPAFMDRLDSMSSADHSGSLRVSALVAFLQASRRVDKPDTALIGALLPHLIHWAHWLADEKRFVLSNHGVMSSMAILHAVVQLEGVDPEVATLRAAAMDRVRRIVAEAFDDDAMCNENTLGYHNFNLRLYRQLARFARAHDIDASFATELEHLVATAEVALAHGIWQDGNIPPLGDSFVYAASVDPINISKSFRGSGCTFIKDEELYLSFVCGSRSEGHKQLDDTSVTLRYRNRDVLVDAGSYNYDHTDPYRRSIASTLGHSGLFPLCYENLTRREVLTPAPQRAERTTHFQQGPTWNAVRGISGTAHGAITSRREVLVAFPDEVVIVDHAWHSLSIPTAGWTIRFLFGPEQQVREIDQSRLEFSDGVVSGTLHHFSAARPVFARGQEPNDTQPAKGWYSAVFQSKEPTTDVSFQTTHRSLRAVTMIALREKVDCNEFSDLALQFAAGTWSPFAPDVDEEQSTR